MFQEKQKVVCISDAFPCTHDTGDGTQIGKTPIIRPIVGRTYVIDEILGEYIRFEELDCNDPNAPEYGYKWWHQSRFVLYKMENTEMAISMKVENSVFAKQN